MGKVVFVAVISIVALAVGTSAQESWTGAFRTDFFQYLGDNGGPHMLPLLVQGKPYLLRTRTNSRQVVYQRAKDASGITWETPRIVLPVDAASNLGKDQIEVAIIDAKPSIIIAKSQELFFYQSDVTGTAWPQNMSAALNTVATHPLASEKTISLFEHDGAKPATCVQRSDSSKLYFFGANSTDGAGKWRASLIADVTNFGVSVSCASDANGRPWAVYTDKDIFVVQAVDATGNSWGTPMSIKSTGALGANDRYTNVRARFIDSSFIAGGVYSPGGGTRTLFTHKSQSFTVWSGSQEGVVDTSEQLRMYDYAKVGGSDKVIYSRYLNSGLFLDDVLIDSQVAGCIYDSVALLGLPNGKPLVIYNAKAQGCTVPGFNFRLGINDTTIIGIEATNVPTQAEMTNTPTITSVNPGEPTKSPTPSPTPADASSLWHCSTAALILLAFLI